MNRIEDRLYELATAIETGKGDLSNPSEAIGELDRIKGMLKKQQAESKKQAKVGGYIGKPFKGRIEWREDDSGIRTDQNGVPIIHTHPKTLEDAYTYWVDGIVTFFLPGEEVEESEQYVKIIDKLCDILEQDRIPVEAYEIVGKVKELINAKPLEHKGLPLNHVLGQYDQYQSQTEKLVELLEPHFPMKDVKSMGLVECVETVRALLDNWRRQFLPSTHKEEWVVAFFNKDHGIRFANFDSMMGIQGTEQFNATKFDSLLDAQSAVGQFPEATPTEIIQLSHTSTPFSTAHRDEWVVLYADNGRLMYVTSEDMEARDWNSSSDPKKAKVYTRKEANDFVEAMLDEYGKHYKWKFTAFPLEPIPPSPSKEEWVCVISHNASMGYLDKTMANCVDNIEAAKIWPNKEASTHSLNERLASGRKWWDNYLLIPLSPITPQPEGEVIWEGYVAGHKDKPYYLCDIDGIVDLFQSDPFHDNDLMNSEGAKMKDHAVYNEPIPVRLVKGGGES